MTHLKVSNIRSYTRHSYFCYACYQRDSSSDDDDDNDDDDDALHN